MCVLILCEVLLIGLVRAKIRGQTPDEGLSRDP